MELKIKEVLESIDIDNVEKYLNGCAADAHHDNTANYQKQINDAVDNINKCIDRIKNGTDNTSTLWGCISQYGKIYRDMYFELGICTGVKIGYQLDK